MADNQEVKKDKVKAKFTEAKNAFKFFLMNLGFPVHVEGAETAERIKSRINSEVNFGVVGTMNKLMIQTEREWEGYEKSIKEDWVKIVGLYSYKFDKDDHVVVNKEADVDESLGPFTDPRAVSEEGVAAEYGTGIKEETITIVKGDERIIGEFTIPNLSPVHYHDGRADPTTEGKELRPNNPVSVESHRRGNLGIAYELAFVGSLVMEPYWRKLSSDIDGIAETVKQWYFDRITDETQRRNVEGNITNIVAQAKQMMGGIKDWTLEFEENHRKHFVAGGGVTRLHAELGGVKSSIYKKPLKDYQVFFTHTYKIVKPYTLFTIKEREKVLSPYNDFMENFKRATEGRNLNAREIINIEFQLLTRHILQKEASVDVLVYLDPSKNPFEEELRKVEQEINDLDINGLKRRRLTLQEYLMSFEGQLKIKEEQYARNPNPMLISQIQLLAKRKWKVIYEIEKTRLKIREWQKAEFKRDNLIRYNQEVQRVRSDPVYREFVNSKWPWEQGIGLDENGWPLEVGDGESLFDGKILEKGIVLLDKYLPLATNPLRKRQVPRERKAPEAFIGECDLLDASTWMYVHYDSFRDDLRDARYHDGAITIMDRIMTELRTPYHKHPIHKKWIFGRTSYWQDDTLKQTEVEIKLNKLASGHEQWRPPTDPSTIKSPIQSLHLNPVFDIRAERLGKPTGRGWDRHYGRVYYYDVQDSCEQSPYPTITTRGASMYILHRIIEESKYWGGGIDKRAAGKTGVMEIVESIGTQINGWDIGANMGRPPKYSGWGKDLPRNPFRPERG